MQQKMDIARLKDYIIAKDSIKENKQVYKN